MTKFNIKSINAQALTNNPYFDNLDSSFMSNDEEFKFDNTNDVIEFYVFNPNGDIIFPFQGVESPQIKYIDNKLELDPRTDLESRGYDIGKYQVLYNFYRSINKKNSYINIEEVSLDGFEILIEKNEDLISFVSGIKDDQFPELYLNMGMNRVNPIINIENNESGTLIKLSEPIAEDFLPNSWVSQKINNSKAFELEFKTIIDENDNVIKLTNPNFNIKEENLDNSKQQNSLNLDELLKGGARSTSLIKSYLEKKGVEINIDYSKFENFIKYSSSYNRTFLFYKKMELIYDSSDDNLIETTLKNFDGYEQYLYSTYPRVGNGNVRPPNSGVVISTINANIRNSKAYDLDNTEALNNRIPQYIRENNENELYSLFVDMIGQMYDNIWTYIKSITDKFDNDNRLNFGVSADLLDDLLRDFGVKLYNNSFSNEDLYNTFLGEQIEEILTSTQPAGFGKKLVNSIVVDLNKEVNSVPLTSREISQSLEKRIYHNLNYLLKSKGTKENLRTLLSIYGIPNSLLKVNSFGNNPEDASSAIDNFALTSNTSAYYTYPEIIFNAGNWSGSRPRSEIYNNIESATFRFKFKKSGGSSQNAQFYQENIQSVSGDEFIFLRFYVRYFYNSGIVRIYMGELRASPFQETTREIAQFPIDVEWVVLSTKNDNFRKRDYVFTSSDDRSTDQTASPSLVTLGGNYAINVVVVGAPAIIINEFRLTKGYRQDDATNLLTNNNYTSGTQVVLRMGLGTEPDNIYGLLQQNAWGSSNIELSFRSLENGFLKGIPSPSIIKRKYTGVESIVENNIIIEDAEVLEGDTLSYYTSIEKENRNPITINDNLEVVFSPQDEINERILNILPDDFEISGYIGDVREINSDSRTYNDLKQLMSSYENEFTGDYNVVNFFSLLNVYNESLFKMIRNFVPSDQKLTSGVLIKQHILERNKQRPAQVSYINNTLEGQIKPQVKNFNLLNKTGSPYEDKDNNNIYKFGGTSGGSFEKFNKNSFPQIKKVIKETPSGIVNVDNKTQEEFYTGDFEGTTIKMTDGELNTTGAYKKIPNNPLGFIPIFYYNEDVVSKDEWLKSNNAPKNGQIWLYLEDIPLSKGVAIGRGSSKNITYIKISNVDINSNLIANYLLIDKSPLTLIFNNITIRLEIDGVQNIGGYLLAKIKPIRLRDRDLIIISERGSIPIYLNINTSSQVESQLTIDQETFGPGQTTYINYWENESSNFTDIPVFGDLILLNGNATNNNNINNGSFSFDTIPNVGVELMVEINYKLLSNGANVPTFGGTFFNLLSYNRSLLLNTNPLELTNHVIFPNPQGISLDNGFDVIVNPNLPGDTYDLPTDYGFPILKQDGISEIELSSTKATYRTAPTPNNESEWVNISDERIFNEITPLNSSILEDEPGAFTFNVLGKSELGISPNKLYLYLIGNQQNNGFRSNFSVRFGTNIIVRFTEGLNPGISRVRLMVRGEDASEGNEEVNTDSLIFGNNNTEVGHFMLADDDLLVDNSLIDFYTSEFNGGDSDKMLYFYWEAYLRPNNLYSIDFELLAPTVEWDNPPIGPGGPGGPGDGGISDPGDEPIIAP